MEQDDKLKKIFDVLRSNKETRGEFQGMKYGDFREVILSNKEAQDALHSDLVKYDLISTPDPDQYWQKVGIREAKQKTPLDITREQIRTPMAAEQLPFKQFGTQEATGQPQTTKPIGVLASDKGPDLAQIQRDLVIGAPQEKQDKTPLWQKVKQVASDVASGFNRAVAKTPSGIAKTVAEIGTGIANTFGGDIKAEDDYLYQLADKYDKWIDDSEIGKQFIGDKNVNSLAGDVGSGLGQVATMIASGGGSAANALKANPTLLKRLGKEIFNPASGLAFTQIFNSEYENMKAQGESDKTAFYQALMNSVAGAPLERLPLANLAERMEQAIGAPIAKRIINAILQGGEEMTQEGVQQLFSNLTNNQLVELEGNIKKWNEGLERSADAGGIVGTLLGLIAGVKGGKVRGQQPPSQLGGIPTEQQTNKRQNPDGSVTITEFDETKIPEEYKDRVQKEEFARTGLTSWFGGGKPVYRYQYTVSPDEANTIEDVLFEDVTTSEPEAASPQINEGLGEDAQEGVNATDADDMGNPITGKVVQEEIPEVDAIPIADVEGIPDYNPEELSIGENIYYSFDGKDYYKGEVVSRPSAAKKNVYTVKNENGIPTVIIYGGERTNVKLKSEAANSTPQSEPTNDTPTLSEPVVYAGIQQPVITGEESGGQPGGVGLQVAGEPDAAARTGSPTENMVVDGEVELNAPVQDLPKVPPKEIAEGFTEGPHLNKIVKAVTAKLGNKAKKYFEQVDRLFNPNKVKIIEYRTNGVITEENGRPVFNGLGDTDLKNWRISWRLYDDVDQAPL